MSDPRDFEELHLYEAMKKEWLENHPDATPAEFTAAMREIAEKAGA